MAPQQSPEHRRRRLLSHGVATTSSTPAQGATDCVVSLSNDLIFDILSRLPVRTVCRCRCVSREWCALISDTTFIAAHKSRHGEALVCVAGCFREHKFYYDLRLMDMDGSVMTVVEDIGGITELLSTSMDDFVCVHNYVSGKTRLIDPARGEVLAHRQEKEYRIVGFGRAVPSGAYKVVCVRIQDQACKVFTLGADTTWRPPRFLPTFASNIRGPPAVMNGVMYFLVSLGLYNDTLLHFDIEREEWKKGIEGPSKATGTELWKTNDPGSITEFNDSLCYVHSDMSNKNRCVNIF